MINSLSASGGAEQGLVREICRFDSSVAQAVVRLYEANTLGSELQSAGIPNISLGLDPSNSGWNWPAGVVRLLGEIRRFRPDVVHTSLASSNLVGQLAAGFAGVPALSTFTLSGDPGLMRRYQPGAASSRAAVLRRIEGYSARRDHVWFRALTQDAKRTNSAASGIDESRVVVIPRGVPLPESDRSDPEPSALGLPTDSQIILNVGRQTAQKGHRHLVAAFARIRHDRAVPVHLVILGREGDASGALEAAITEFEVEDAVTIVPYTDRTYDYYRTADVFAFSSLMEGLGTAVLEAMACRLPVVAYDIPPVREIAGESIVANLVPVGDVTALAAAIGAVLDDPVSAEAMAGRAQSRVAAEYSVDGVARRLQDRLSSLAESAAPSR